jgi:lysozyme family protein
MANFDNAYNITLGHEGGYVNNPVDKGKETYKGISRKYHPNWPGWVIIDAAKSMPTFPKALYTNPVLDKLTKDFYKDTFWDTFQGDLIPSQVIANELFDTGVNMGQDDAVRFLQRSLNALNRRGKLYPNISVDGKFGNNTLKSLKDCLSLGDELLLYKMINTLQGVHYIERTEEDESQEDFTRGWFNRVEFIKN